MYYKCVHQWSSISNVKLTEKDGNRQLEIFLSYFWKVQLCQIEYGKYREEIEVLDEAADDERVTFLSFSILYHLIILKKTYKKIQKGYI